MPKQQNFQGQARDESIKRSKWLKELQAELKTVTRFHEQGGSDRELLAYFRERRDEIREQISYLILFIKQQHGNTEEKRQVVRVKQEGREWSNHIKGIGVIATQKRVKRGTADITRSTKRKYAKRDWPGQVTDWQPGRE